MEEIQISKFKATCLAVLAGVARTGQPILVTRFGQPVAQIVPPPRALDEWLGSMRHRGEILGDLIEPATEPGDWEALIGGSSRPAGSTEA